MKHNKNENFVLFLFIFLIFLMLILSFATNLYIPMTNNVLELSKISISFILLIFSVYFLVLPGKFIIGGLESNLIFLDKIFFYDKKKQKQKYFFSKNNNIIIIRILILIFALVVYLKDSTQLNLFLSSIIFSLLFAFILKIFNFFKIKQNYIIKKFPQFIQNNIFYRLLLSSLITGFVVGISCGNILKQELSTGGTDVIFVFLTSTSICCGIELSAMLLIVDGLTILLSFLMDLIRKKKNKNKIVIKYFFSILTFFIALGIIHLLTKQNNKII